MAPLFRARVTALLLVAAMVVTAVLASGASSSSGDKVYLLNAMYSTNSYTVNHAKAIWLGMDAAFHHAAYTAAGGRRIEIVSPSSSVNESDIVAVVEAALAEYPSLLGVLGPYGDANLAAGLASSTLTSSSLMLLAPFTGSSVVRTWNENAYFMRAEPRLEIMAIVKHIANTLRSLRSAFMYQTGIGFGDAAYADFVSLMATVGLNAPVLYSVPYSTTSTAVNTTAFDAMADTYPQVIVLWGIPSAQTGNFLEAVLTDPRTSSAYIISSFVLQQLVFDVYYGLALAGTITPVAGQVLSSATVFPISLAGTEHIPMFMAQMSAYMKDTGNVDASLWAAEASYVAKYGSSYASASGSSSYADAFLYEHPSTAQLMLTGWLAGTLVMQTLGESNWFTDRATYQAYLFQQHRYILGGDFVLGDYGGACDPVAQFLSAVCYCNQGGHAAVLSNLSGGLWTVITDSGVNYTQNNCYSTSTGLPRPINFLTLTYTDRPSLTTAGVELNSAIADMVKYIDYTTNPVNFATLLASTTTAQALFDAQVDNFTADLIAGPISSSLNAGDFLVLSPVFPHPHLVQATQNYVYLMPTLEQQFFLLYENLAAVSALTSIGASVQAVLHDYDVDEADNLTAVLQKSAATFNYADPTVTVVSASTTVGSALADNTVNFVVGLTINDVASIADFLAAHPTAIVVVCFDDLSLQYSAMAPAFSALTTSVQARLISFSNLPLWSDTSASAEAASPLLQVFHGALNTTALYTPGLLRDIAIGAFVFRLVALSTTVSTSAMQDMVYQSSTVATYGMTFGAFNWGCSMTRKTSACVYQNYGAQDISMLSMERMLNPTVPALTTASTPSLVYTPRTTSGLTAAQRSGVIAGAVVGGLALIAAVALLVYCCRDSRDNDAAPKEGREPVTLIFTDIESSTAMWAALPQLMADAIAAHHRVIRQLIRKYGCYEVKTVGDSFMIACKDAYSAVRLACEIQTRLLEHDWGTTEIDSTYREFELARVDAVEDYVPPTARLSAEEYAALWRGLRVRVGVHTGLSDIRYDEVTKGYDYYGDTSNMAARTEAIANGGQVVATETTWWALSDEERAATAHTAMGRQGLRGVPFAVEMYQLNAVPGRKHAALRTEIEATLPDDNTTETASSAAGALLSSAGTMTGAAAGVAFVITSCFSPYPPVQRVRELQPLLAKWNVGAPPRSRQVSEEDYCKGLINRLAIRIASVTHARQVAHGMFNDDARSFTAFGSASASLGVRSAHSSFAGSPRSAVSHVEVPDRHRESSPVHEARSLPRLVIVTGSRCASARVPRGRGAGSPYWGSEVVPLAADDDMNDASMGSSATPGSSSTVNVVRPFADTGVRRRWSRPESSTSVQE